jgi:hypothetical protein
MQYRMEKKPGRVLAVAENQKSVGKQQFERAAYYTHKTVAFSAEALPSLLHGELHS